VTLAHDGRLARLWLGVLAAVGLCAGGSSARDANRVHTFVVGRGSAFAACEGLDAQNDQRASGRFPGSLELTLRTRVSGGIGQAPVSDREGSLIFVHAEPRLSKLDAGGRALWSQRLPAEATCSPVLMSGGSILVVTLDAQALLFSSTGTLQKKGPLAVAEPRRRTVAIPTASGGAWVGSGRDVLQFDADGTVLRQARLLGNVSALVEMGPDTLAIEENGTVEVARVSGDFRRLGTFSGSVLDGAAGKDDRVVALVDGHQVQTLHRVTGEVTTWVNDPSVALSGPLALLAAGGAAWVVDGGLISVHSSAGAETLRVPVGALGQPFNPSSRGLAAARLVSDDQGVIAAARSGMEAIVIGPDGSVARIEGTACVDPFRPTPTRSGVVFACRSGQIFAATGKSR
jgi:hypothetical protein